MMWRTSAEVCAKCAEVDAVVAELRDLTEAEKGALLFANVKDLATVSGDNPDFILAMLTQYGGLVEGVEGATNFMVRKVRIS